MRLGISGVGVTLAAVAMAATGCAVAATASGVEHDNAASITVFGQSNELLAAGAEALDMGRVREGVELTISGLQRSNSPQDEAAGRANLCAGYALLQRWDEALIECNRSLDLDRGNWRAFNNRAAVFVAKGQLDLAIADVAAGLAIAPDSKTLKKSLEVVQEHQRALHDHHRRGMQA
jgi:tetratricopeptide (TPR) repeat protein